jgi:dolichol-phosphate mannosyltransferase
MGKKLNLLKSLKPYFGKFSLVGISGIIVNQGFLTFFVSVLGWDVSIAGIIAIEISILSNFFLNNYWTWKDQKKSTFFSRFVKYHAVTIVSGGVNYLILIILTSMGLHYFISNLFGIAIGTVINFIFNHFWTFKASDKDQDHELN